MKKANAIFASLSAALICGCLSIVRMPLCSEKVSDEGEVTNRVWHSFCDDVPGMRIYPTVKIRCKVTSELIKPIPEEAKGADLRRMRLFKRYGWIPLSIMWITSPVDAAIDTLFLPWDIHCIKHRETETDCMQ